MTGGIGGGLGGGAGVGRGAGFGQGGTYSQQAQTVTNTNVLVLCVEVENIMNYSHWNVNFTLNVSYRVVEVQFLLFITYYLCCRRFRRRSRPRNWQWIRNRGRRW